MQEEHAKEKGAWFRIIVADLFGDVHEVTGKFDFAFDWEFLHHIFPEDRETYIRNVHKLLNYGGASASVCFSEKAPSSEGAGSPGNPDWDDALFLLGIRLRGPRLPVFQVPGIKNY